jgi:hypothetical protein
MVEKCLGVMDQRANGMKPQASDARTVLFSRTESFYCEIAKMAKEFTQ